IVHAYQGEQKGQINIDCNLYEAYIEVIIKDYGKGIADIKQAMRPFYTTGAEGERSGMGFTVMQAFCDKVDVASKNGETVVTLIKNI
ncbi:MAG: ATP-binding protein, partial [Clostridia bacterium]|nr:ATP-binding protein [Clostridia bacterium]